MGTVQDSQNQTPFLQQFSFGVGHVIFDVANLMLSSYRLVFLMRVVGLSASNAGWITLYSRSLGAIIIRPIAGYLCDKVNMPVVSRKHGRRMTWHLLGTVLTAVSMPLFFSSCLVCSSEPSQWQLMVYHVVIGTCLPTSYIFIEIAYLSLVPFIAKNQSEAVKLNALRVAFTFLTGIVYYLVAWAILGRNSEDQLTSASSMDFTVVTLILIGIGLFFAVIFHIGTKEPTDDTSVNRKLSITKADIERKSSLIACALMKSVVYTGNEKPIKDFPEKEQMCDQIVHILKLTDEATGVQDTGEENKTSNFQRHFIDALFYVDEEEEASENKVAEEWISKIEEASFSSKARTGDHEVLLREVSALPQERRRSLLSSILDRLIRLDVNESTNENVSNHSEENDSTEITSSSSVGEELNLNNESHEIINCLTSKKKENGIGDGQHLSTAQKGSENKYTTTKDQDNNKTQEENLEAGSPDGIDRNNGFDGGGIESRLCSPDPNQITGANVNQIYTNYVTSKSPEMDPSTTSGTLMENKLFFVSPDPETALPATASPKTIRAWLKDPRLYKVAIIYACARHLQELSYSYLPLFLTDTLKFEEESIAYLPLIMLLGATVSTVITKKVIGKKGSKWSFILAGLLVAGSCVWFYFITQSTKVLTYPAAALLGFGFSAMFVNALSFATELIGDDKNNSGFVFSFFGVLTSLTGAALVGVIQNFFPEESDASKECEECDDYVRLVFLVVHGSLAAISMLVVLVFQAQASHKTSKPNASKADVATQTATSAIKVETERAESYAYCRNQETLIVKTAILTHT